MFKPSILSGFNGYPESSCHLIYPSHCENLTTLFSNGIARGQGLSYGDAAMNTTGVVISTKHLNRIISFDAETGILTTESGITLDQICELIVPRGWFLPVMPGTALISVGGAVAADVHGKNHYHAGSFSQHVLWFELICADGTKVRCSPEENMGVFWATIGGMGLTGFIALVCLKLKPIKTPLMQVKTEVADNLKKTLNLLETRSSEYEYTVAWIDARHKLLRGVVMSAEHVVHAMGQSLYPTSRGSSAGSSANLKNSWIPRIKSLPLRRQGRGTSDISAMKRMPSISFVNTWTTKLFNQLYYWSKKQKIKDDIVHYQTYFFPLDKIKHWPSLYGKNKFIQYQCEFPCENALMAVQKLFDIFKQKKILCSLVVLKRFGSGNQAPLSFPKEGITIAIDIPFTSALLDVLDLADEWVASQGGRVYLAKDARLSRQLFLQMYPEYLNWMKIKKILDPKNAFRSMMSDRLLSSIAARRISLLEGNPSSQNLSPRRRGSAPQDDSDCYATARPPMKKTDNIVILGATSAIAQGCCKALAEKGVTLYLAGRNIQALEQLATALRNDYKIVVHCGHFNAEKTDDHKEFFDQMLQLLGRIDGVILAFGYLDNFLSWPTYSQQEVIFKRNLLGAVSVLTLFANYFEQRKQGYMIVITSISGDRGRRKNYVYSAAKSALTVYLQGLRNQLHQSGVRVITIKPGFVDTPMTQGRKGLFLVAQPEKVGRRIIKQLQYSADVIYVPWFWRYLMLIIKLIPEFLYKRIAW